MPSIVFNFGDTSKEVDLKDINSPEDLASNMKEVITEEKAKTSDQPNWFKDGNLAKYYEVE